MVNSFYKKLLLFCHCICVSYGFLFSRIGLEQYAHTWTCVADNKKHLSPFNGAMRIESNFIEKMHTFGNVTTKEVLSSNNLKTEYVIDGDSNMKLLWLILKTEGGQLSHRAGSTHIADYLTPRIIGKLLNAIESNPKKTRQDAQNLECVLSSIMWKSIVTSSPALTSIKKWLNKIRTCIKQDLPQITAWFGKFYGGSIDPFGLKIDINHFDSSLVNNLLAWGRREVLRQQKIIKAQKEKSHSLANRKKNNLYSFKHFSQAIPKAYKSKIKKAHEQWLLVHKKIASIAFQNQFYAVQKKISRKKRSFLAANTHMCAKLIIESLKECGYFHGENNQANTLYPPYTVHDTLLSLLYFTIEKPSDLITYFAQFRPSILAKEYTPSTFDFAKIKNDTKQFFTKNSTQQETFIENNFEETCLLGLLNQETPFPKEVSGEYFQVTYKSGPFMACGEEAMANFARILMTILGIYDPQNAIFKIDQLEEKLAQRIKEKKVSMPLGPCKIKEFFQESIPNNCANITQGDIFQSWVKFITNLPGIKYLRNYYTIKNNTVEKMKKISQHNPFIHPSTQEFCTYKDYGKSITTPCNKTDYLAEIPGTPSNYVTITNYLFGLQLKDFKELCSFFDLTLEQSNYFNIINYLYTDTIEKNFGRRLENFQDLCSFFKITPEEALKKCEASLDVSDNALYAEKLGTFANGFPLTVQCSVNEITYSFCIEISIGHTSVYHLNNTQKNVSDPYGLATTIKNNLALNTENNNLWLALSCYTSLCDNKKQADFTIKDYRWPNRWFFLNVKDLLSRDITMLSKAIIFTINSNCADITTFDRFINRFVEYSKNNMQRGDVDCIKNTINDIVANVYSLKQKKAIKTLYTLGSFFLSYNNNKASEWFFHIAANMLNFFSKHHKQKFADYMEEYEQILDWVTGPLKDKLEPQQFHELFKEYLYIGVKNNIFTHTQFVKILCNRINDVITHGGAREEFCYNPEMYSLCLVLLDLPESRIDFYKKNNIIKQLLPLTKNYWNYQAPNLLEKVISSNKHDDLIPLIWQKLVKTFMKNNCPHEAGAFLNLLLRNGIDDILGYCKKFEGVKQLIEKTHAQKFTCPLIKKKVKSLKKMAIRMISLCLIANDEPYRQKAASTIDNPCILGDLLKKKPFYMKPQEILARIAEDITAHCTAQIKKLTIESKKTLCTEWKTLDHVFLAYKINEIAKRIAPRLSCVKRQQWANNIETYLNDTINNIAKEVMPAKFGFITQWFSSWWYGDQKM